MFRSKSFKKLLCMIITFSLVLTGSAFSVAAEEQTEGVGILSDESVTEEAASGLIDESAAAVTESSAGLTDETVSLISDEEIVSDESEIIEDISSGEEDTEHVSESSDSPAGDLSISDSPEDISADSSFDDIGLADSSLADSSFDDISLADSSLTDSSLTDSSLTDSSLTDSSVAEEILVGSSDDITEGLYVLQSANNSQVCLGIADSSVSNQANVELVSNNGGYARAFYVKKSSDGYYYLINYHTGKAVHIPGGNKTPGSNVVQYAVRDLQCQKWSLKYDSTKTYVTIQSSLCGLYLDCAGGKSTAGTNICLNKLITNAKREMWKLVPASGKVAAEARLTDANITKGYYYINIYGHKTLTTGVENASTATGANICVNTKGNTYSQVFRIFPQGNGLYKIKNVRSGRYLATADGSGGTVNIVQKTASSQDASQLWYILKDPQNGHIIIKPSNSQHRVMAAGGISSGKNILNNVFTNASTQFWALTKTTVYEKNALYKPASDEYYIYPAGAPKKALGVDGGSLYDSARTKLTTKSSSNAKIWRVISCGSGYYKILNAKSGKAIDVAAANFTSGNIIQQYTDNGTVAQRWKFKYTGSENGSFYIVSYDEKYVLDLEGGRYLTNSSAYLENKGTRGTQKYLLQKTGVIKSGWITSAFGQRYYLANGERSTGWVKINNIYYYFYKTGVMARNTTINGYTIDSEGKSNKTDFKTAIGTRTLRALLTNAVAPCGRVLYIWGGGHGGTDTSKIGMLPSWTTFYNSHVSSSYDYNNYRWQYGMGLDCSGFVGWTVYNTLYKEDNVTDLDNTSTQIAADYISRGWCYDSGQKYKPGDIVSRSGHVWISMGTCSDGSVLIMHSTPQGVQLSGTEGVSVTLASKYMNTLKKTTGWPFAVKQYGSDYLTYVGKATWKVDGSGIITDPDGMQKMSAEQVCKIVFGY